jgi:hypothetical protein
MIRLMLPLVLLASLACVRPFTFKNSSVVQVQQVKDAELGYFLVQNQILSESPLPHERPGGSAYRIIEYTEQGSCYPICPRSNILLVLWDYDYDENGRIITYRIDGLRFVTDSLKIVKYDSTLNEGPFLVFTINSNADTAKPIEYRVSAGFQGATVERTHQDKS